MNDVVHNNQLLDVLMEKIQQDETKYVLFSTAFRFEMAKTSCLTLKNINALTQMYRTSYTEKEDDGTKALYLFGVLQGLFVAIDSLYTIGHATTLNKMIINLNQNEILREIKHIRNDVVGHPNYRQYEGDSVGFCVLDLEHIIDEYFIYWVYTFEDNQIRTQERRINMLEVIDNYYQESNDTLEQTIQFLTMKEQKESVDISTTIAMLGFRFQKGNVDVALLEEIKNKYTQTFHLHKKSSNRVLWRLRLIEKLFHYNDQNAYTKYLTILEIYKLYGLIHSLEKQLVPNLRYRFVRFEKNDAIESVKTIVQSIKKHHFDVNVLHDFKHPLYETTMQTVIDACRHENKTKGIIDWIQKQIKNKEADMLYLIGSVLKK